VGDFLAVVALVVVVLIVVVLEVSACLMVAIGVAIVYTVLLPSEYISAMIQRIDDEMPAPWEIGETVAAAALRLTSRQDSQIAFASYFFGPAEVDAKEILRAAFARCAKRCRSAASSTGIPNPDEGFLIGLVIFIGIWLGLIMGAILGFLCTAVVATTHIVVMTTVALAMISFSFALRGADSAMRFARGVMISCPNPTCSRRVRPYPAYRCPSCRKLHRDIRPGPLGVLRRVCTCGERLPTLLLIGAGRLDAVCQQCGQELPAGIGTAAEIIAPVFGSVNAGKTQLVYMLTLALGQLAEERNTTLVMDSDTDRRLKLVGETLTSSGNTAPTLAESPEPYICRLKVGLYERIIYLFDAAGEIHHRLATLERLRYLDKGRTLIFVADPVSSDGFWSAISSADQVRLSDSRSSLDDIELAYELTREQMRRMSRRSKSIRFAFVLSKADLIENAEAWKLRTGHHDALREIFVDPTYMDLGNLIREAEQSFKSVDFFATAAVRDEDGLVDDSVVELARWILDAEGVLSV
jgi:hypothetical protein